jgi:cytochrome c
MRFAAALALAFAVPLFTGVAAPALAATGEELFNNVCADCHALDPQAGQTAPPLRGVAGRKIASVPDFQYSDALKAKSAERWTDANLDAFIASPQTFAPGTAMYGGASDPDERKAIIDYLKTVR